MANNDGVQRWVIANVPYYPISVIAYKNFQRIRTELYHGPVTARRNGLEARIGVTVGCYESNDEHKESTAESPVDTSASPRLESRWIAISRSGVETIRLESCDSSG